MRLNEIFPNKDVFAFFCQFKIQPILSIPTYLQHRRKNFAVFGLAVTALFVVFKVKMLFQEFIEFFKMKNETDFFCMHTNFAFLQH